MAALRLSAQEIGPGQKRRHARREISVGDGRIQGALRVIGPMQCFWSVKVGLRGQGSRRFMGSDFAANERYPGIVGADGGSAASELVESGKRIFGFRPVRAFLRSGTGLVNQGTRSS